MKINKTFFSSNFFFLSTLMISNGVNFFYNAYLGKVLRVEDFGNITFINTLLYLATILATAFASTTTNRVGFLSTEVTKSAGFTFLQNLQKQTVFISIVISIFWISALSFIAPFFHIIEVRSLFFFTPILLTLFMYANNRGYLLGSINFFYVSILLLCESVSKLSLAIILTIFHFEKFVYISIPLSIVITCVLSFYFLNNATKRIKKINDKQYAFPKRFFVSAFITGIATSGFLSLDVVLVKHFLDTVNAGEYSFLSFAGKMIFFFGSLVSSLIITYTSRDLGQGKDPNKTFYTLLGICVALTCAGFVLVGLLGRLYFPLIFGTKTNPVLSYLPLFSLTISFFTIANAFTIYHLARHHYSFSILSLLSLCAMISGIYFFHVTLLQIITVLFFIAFVNLFFAVILHLLKRNGKFILRNIIDLLDVFTTHPYKNKTKEKRVLIFNWRDTKHIYAGGAEVYIHELAKRWVEKGLVVTLFCGNDGRNPRNEMIDGIHIIRRGGFYFVYFWAFIYYIMRFRGKFDVIIDTQNGIPFFTPLYAKEKVYCLMFHVHQDVFFRSLSKPLATFASVLENRLMPWAYRNTHFITISNSTKKEMKDLDLGKTGITIVNPGINTKLYIPARKHNKPLIAYIGRLQFYKSLHIFLHAIKLLSKKLPHAEFIIAGDGEEKGKLEELAKELDIENNIQFLGKIPEKKKIDLYQKAWVVVNPSMKEGWGITTIEANACATPVVASDVAGLRDSVNNPHTGFLVEYGNAHAFADKIEDVVSKPLIRKQMQKQTVSWAKKFDWDISAKKSMRVIL